MECLQLRMLTQIWWTPRASTIGRYRCEKVNLPIYTKPSGSRPLASIVCLMAVTYWRRCCVIWFMRHFEHRWVSMMVVDGLVPIWHQAICNHRDGISQCISGTLNATVLSAVCFQEAQLLKILLSVDAGMPQEAEVLTHGWQQTRVSLDCSSVLASGPIVSQQRPAAQVGTMEQFGLSHTVNAMAWWPCGAWSQGISNHITN